MIFYFYFFFYINFTVFVCSRRQIQCLKCGAGPSPTGTATAPQWNSLWKDKPKCAMFLVLLCRAMNHFENMLRAIATRRHRERAKKSHLKDKNKCKRLYFRNSSYEEWEHKYQTMRTVCLWCSKEWESLFFSFLNFRPIFTAVQSMLIASV